MAKKEIDWDSEAKRAVELVSTRLNEAHRGAVVWHGPTDTVLVFSNAGNAARQVEKLTTRFLAKRGFEIRATATTDDDYSFVMLVHYPESEENVEVHGDRVEDCTECVWLTYWWICLEDDPEKYEHPAANLSDGVVVDADFPMLKDDPDRDTYEEAQREIASQRIDRFMSGLENWWAQQVQR